jgi:para-aminobenzoate synthetase
VTDPAGVFAEVAAQHPRCFWLDGGGARDWSGRRSIIGWLDPGDVSLTLCDGVVSRHVDGRSEPVGDDMFAVLEHELGQGGQWFGYLGYASRPDLPARAGVEVPDAIWMRPSHVRMFEHPDGGPDSVLARTSATVEGPPRWYAEAFAAVQERLHAGDSYEVNLTYREQVASDLDPAAAYLRLRALNPAPYAGFLQHDVDGARGWLLSSSPERYALIDADRVIEAKPIKGTTPRGATPEMDEQQRQELQREPKFRAENLMIADLLRNDLSMVCDPGSVVVPSLMDVESYETVHQLVTTVRGRLREGVTTIGALRALFPAGSMTGAPKLRTMEIIEAVESSHRGPYAGAFGWISADGPADLGVVIRSLFTSGDGTWTLGTGGGITVDSEVTEEWAETRWKADRLRHALD